MPLGRPEPLKRNAARVDSTLEPGYAGEGDRVPEWLWIIANVGLGLPLAAALVVLIRETSRGILAPALGFRVFEVQWGAGIRSFEGPIGPVDVALAPWPLAGTTVARSGSPRRHRAARIALAAAPMLVQLGWLFGRLLAGTPPGTAPLFAAPAPLACLDLANVLLLVTHATLAIELPGGVRTDVRLLLDAFLGGLDSDRAARANYYARLARHRLERADVEGARAAIDQGCTQLGPEALLVSCAERMKSSDLDSVVDQGDCADALERLIEAAEPNRRIERARWTWAERTRQAFFTAAPLTTALLALVFVQADRLARSVEERMIAYSETAAESGDVARCEAMIEGWDEWTERVDRWLPPSAPALSDRHLGLARLERCRGRLEASAGHRTEAMLAANEALVDLAQGVFVDAEHWLENELRLASLLRHAAEVEHERRSYRAALATLSQADRKLVRLRGQLGVMSEGDARTRAEASLEREHRELVAMRGQILTGMSSR